MALLCLLALAGCGQTRHTSPAAPPPSPSRPTNAGDAPLPLTADRRARERMLRDSLRKRVAGRRSSLPDVERIVGEVAPLVALAARQPQVQGALRQIARDENLSLEATRALWMRLQEADLLLESGGDPDVVSPAGAVGVAQWLAPTARANGLRVDEKASEALTRQITTLDARIAWAKYLLRPDADPAAPGAPGWTTDDAAAQLPALRAERETLRARRRQVDARYDPQAAILAQTRYLLGRWARFPRFDWLFQAYHGGEAGVTRTLQKFLGGAWPSSATAAIRRGKAGKPLSFEELYFATSPQTHPDAFAYLYGRSDDHRYYWWKLRVAEETIAAYRRNPEAFRRQWEAFLPGRAKEAFWYPDAPAQALPDLPALRAARTRGDLIAVSPRPEFTVRAAPLDMENAPLYAALRPAAAGALRFVTDTYRRAGGQGRLTLGNLALTQVYANRAAALSPPPPANGPILPPDMDTMILPGGGPPADVNLHVAGLAFDVLRPSDTRSRKILEYALGQLADRDIVWWRDVPDSPERHYHVVPNPRFARALERIAATEQAPVLSSTAPGGLTPGLGREAAIEIRFAGLSPLPPCMVRISVGGRTVVGGRTGKGEPLPLPCTPVVLSWTLQGTRRTRSPHPR